jgi:glutathione synthase/RimK-type ligase-like ATP-grasp enzyme
MTYAYVIYKSTARGRGADWSWEDIMLILLSDGAGLTSRQAATVLARAGHRVEALSPRGLCLGRMTRHVRRVHEVPPLGRDPFGWLDAALDVAARRGADLLLPVQEQVAVMALARDRIEAAGLATAVPSFAALAQVQDKVSACRTLARIGVPQPPSLIAASAADLAQAAELPAFVKTPIGTASAGVRRVSSGEELRRLAEDYERLGIFAGGGAVLVQQPTAGPLVMVQAVFADGELVAFHACERAREGVAGGASHKRGRLLPQAREQMARLGAALTWHGALSADVIDGPEGPVFIDINPRLVEPANALASGVDLTRALVEVALTGRSRPQPDGTPGTRTHQLLLAVLGAGQRGRRRDVARELADAALRRRCYRDSREELTPSRGDLLAPVPVAAAALATLAWPPTWRQFVGGSAGAYSLTPAAWAELTEAARARTAVA